MALFHARMLVKTGWYVPKTARKEYQYWLDSDPFDCGMTISAELRDYPNLDSQANGSMMMRISPLGIFGAGFELNQVAEWAMQDAALTHPNQICQLANALFAMGIAHAIQSGYDGKELYQYIRRWRSICPLNPLCWLPSTRLPMSRQRTMFTKGLGVDRFSECPVSAAPCSKH